MKKEKTKCEVCGNETKWGGKTCGHLCASELKKKNNREERVCVYCGEKFIVKKGLPNKLCSDDCRKKWALIPENKEKRINTSFKAVKEKYNVDYTFQIKEVKEKSKQTKLLRYDNENFVNIIKCRETKKERYNDENYNNIEKNKQTKKANYNDENYNNRPKAEETMNNIFGVSHAMKLEKYQEKARQTNLKNIGVSYPLQNSEIKEKMNKTVMDRYNVSFISQLEEVKEKVRGYYYAKFDLTKINFLLKNSDIILLDEYKGVRETANMSTHYNEYTFQCSKCNTIFLGTFSNHRVPICRKCYPISKNNAMQLEIKKFLENNEINFCENNRKLISPLEVDFLLPDNDIAIELNGNYWHSEVGGDKDMSYHINKTERCFVKGIKLIHIFEDEWLFKKEIVKSRILNLVKKTSNNLYARKCKIIEVEGNKKSNFLDFNHLMGNSNDSVRIGLEFDGELVSLMTFSKRRLALGKNTTEFGSWELNRFCSKINLNVVGGFQRLLNYFIKKYNPKKITTYADVRWSGMSPENTVYFKNGFNFIHQAPPSFWYFKMSDYSKRFHRFTFNKRKLLELCSNCENLENMTGWDLAQSLKMDRIWDCGTLKFEMVI